MALDWKKINSHVNSYVNKKSLTDLDQMHPGAMSSCGHPESEDVYQLLIVCPRHGKQRLVR